MLEAIFYCRVLQKINPHTNETTLYLMSPEDGVSSTSLYRVQGYARVPGSIYTLVFWMLTDKEDPDAGVGGETLWRHTTPVATGGGNLNLYEPPARALVSDEDMSLTKRIDERVGQYGLSMETAIALRNRANHTYQKSWV